MARFTEPINTKTLAFLFEPQCNPIWTVNEQGGLRGRLDDEIHEDDALWDVLEPLQDEFEETCFVLNPGFKVLGFPTDEAMEAFNAKWKAAYEFTKEHLKGRYEVLEPVYFKHRIDDVY